jgi:hypothetical protein
LVSGGLDESIYVHHVDQLLKKVAIKVSYNNATIPVLLGKMIRLSSVQGVTHVSGLGRSKESEAVQRCIDSLLKHGIAKHHVTTVKSALGFRLDLVS